MKRKSNSMTAILERQQDLTSLEELERTVGKNLLK